MICSIVKNFALSLLAQVEPLQDTIAKKGKANKDVHNEEFKIKNAKFLKVTLIARAERY